MDELMTAPLPTVLGFRRTNRIPRWGASSRGRVTRSNAWRYWSKVVGIAAGVNAIANAIRLVIASVYMISAPRANSRALAGEPGGAHLGPQPEVVRWSRSRRRERQASITGGETAAKAGISCAR